jgi:hypothetical protein
MCDFYAISNVDKLQIVCHIGFSVQKCNHERGFFYLITSSMSFMCFENIDM